MKRRDKKQFLKRLCAVLLSAAICMSFAAGCSQGEQTQTAAPQTTEPVPQMTESVLQTVEAATVETTESEDASCDALFFGDSITKGNNFDEFFPQLRIVSIGLGGATIEDLTERVSEVDAHHPAKIFLMAGGNNLESYNEDECVELYRCLLDALQGACPYAEIYIEGMIPLDSRIAMQWNLPNSSIRSFNKRLEELAEEYGLTFLDIYSVYEEYGSLNKEMSRDGIHLRPDSFGPWAEVLRPYLEP